LLWDLGGDDRNYTRLGMMVGATTRASAKKGHRVADTRDVAIREESIRLGQFLKLADLVDTGADAKPLLAGGEVAVNGETETRRGRQLLRGDVVTVGDQVVRVA
jgi:ribosome-associated protein